MKSNTQTTTKTKAQIVKGAKPVLYKKASTAKRASRTANKSATETQSVLSGYSDSAARFIKRGKDAFGDIYTWAGETGSALPKNMRSLGLPDQRSVQTFIGDKPFILGAVGLGIGVVLGAMLPSPIGTSTKPALKSKRRK